MRSIVSGVNEMQNPATALRCISTNEISFLRGFPSSQRCWIPKFPTQVPYNLVLGIQVELLKDFRRQGYSAGCPGTVEERLVFHIIIGHLIRDIAIAIVIISHGCEIWPSWNSRVFELIMGMLHEAVDRIRKGSSKEHKNMWDMASIYLYAPPYCCLNVGEWQNGL
jgi:hypothetical protein